MCAMAMPLCAQTQQSATITVEDSSGAALVGAAMRDAAGNFLGQTDSSGRLNIGCAAMPCRVVVSAAGFAEKTVYVAGATVIEMQPTANGEQVTVTAYRAPLGELESPVTTRVLTQKTLSSTAAITEDDQLRQLPGVELFRRSSSLVANPTSQGVSLRGLGSTSASRTLVTEDDIPLNDPIGGWIDWQEEPELAIERIEVARGGASDLYGSSAIGGVVNVVPEEPGPTEMEVRQSYGGEGTYDESAMAETQHGPWGLLGAGGLIGTDGYIQEAPGQRGPVDDASNVHSQNAMVLVERSSGPLRLFARSNGFEEQRHNGTPYQRNGTRLLRYATGGDWHGPHDGTLTTRFYGSTERYRQTFSSISNLPNFGIATCTYRCGEIPTRYSFIPDNEVGASARWSQPLGAGLLVMGGADVHDVRIWDREQTFGSSAALDNLSDHQRDSGVYAEAMWVRGGWTLTASGRLDWFQNYDGLQLNWNGTGWTPAAATSQPPQFGQRVFDPRVGVSRKLAERWAVSVSGFRAFRAPSPNELYRSTQVGNELTLPNESLLSERATGWETGAATAYRWGSVRASYFVTEVNRPIAAVTTNPTSSPILLKRENLGQIESRGVALDYELKPVAWLGIDGGYQYAHATVTRGTQDVGNWIPEVARNMATMNVRADRPRLGTLTLQGRLSGRQYDDDANDYLLAGYFRLDAYGSRAIGKRVELFAAGENLLNRQIEDSKTPTTTLGMPRVGRVGIQVHFGGL